MTKYIVEFKQILRIFIKGKIMTRDRLTTIIGALIGLICFMLDRYFEIKIPEQMSLTMMGIIVSLMMLIWKPKENMKTRIKLSKKLMRKR